MTHRSCREDLPCLQTPAKRLHWQHRGACSWRAYIDTNFTANLVPWKILPWFMPDGQRFLMNTVEDEATVPPITLILNWKGRR